MQSKLAAGWHAPAIRPREDDPDLPGGGLPRVLGNPVELRTRRRAPWRGPAAAAGEPAQDQIWENEVTGVKLTKAVLDRVALDKA